MATVNPQLKASRRDIAWAAGLFEGEGSINGKRDSNSVALAMGMTDLDVVERFRSVIGGGAIGITVKQPPLKTMHIWRIADSHEVRVVLLAFLPFFGIRRKARALEMLKRLERNRGSRRLRTRCPQGHEYTEENTWRNKNQRGSRQCRTCHRERSHQYYWVNREVVAERKVLRKERLAQTA